MVTHSDCHSTDTTSIHELRCAPDYKPRPRKSDNCTNDSMMANSDTVYVPFPQIRIFFSPELLEVQVRTALTTRRSFFSPCQHGHQPTKSA